MKKKKAKKIKPKPKKEQTRKNDIKKPIDRRTLAYQKILENRGKSVSKALKEAGYSDAYSKNPDQFKKTKKWKDLMEQHLSDDTVAETHGKLLKAHYLDHLVFPLFLEDDEIILLLDEVGCLVRKIKRGDTQVHVWFWSPDNRARKDAVDMAYKLKGKYAPEKLELKKRPLEHLSNEELAAYIREMKNFLLKK